ncbi:DUF2786 domain-containing protein [Azonexus sp.]|jgi:hypothetical protein|uniref:DUF2786 domain-containing protein n=1 Tax=Azonexus sp. TaxID=1872668 RepID=UPI002836B405|nr:DUF2786 domain-containing protein [Azonexus sp.]MDR1995125.1 DUF2786 domain-containing protein [Azonexus sp.]
MSSREKIIEKIRKCLALSSSSNQHEAAAALRQAQKLMEMHSISDMDIAAAEVGERRAKSNVTAKPPLWETQLAGHIADAFGCSLLFTQSWQTRRAEWNFIGLGAGPEVAQYAFSVLLRQVRLARTEHIKTVLKRCKPATKTRRADLFCQGWVDVAASKIDSFASGTKHEATIDAYLTIRYPELTDLKSTDRNGRRNLRRHEVGDLLSGRVAGSNANLNRGIGGDEERRALT